MDIERGRLHAIETNRGRIRSDVFVLATGAESPLFAKPLGCQIPIVPGKGHSMTYQVNDAISAPGASPPPRIPIIFEDSHVAVTPLGDHFRVGSTMQLAGLQPQFERKSLAEDPRRCTELPPLSTTFRCGFDMDGLATDGT